MQFKGRQFPKDIILTAVRWYLAYPLSYRQVEELLAERGVCVDHTTIHRWVIRYSPELHGQLMRRHRRVGKSWRMDETYLRIQGRWHYLYRAVDKTGRTIDFKLSRHRDEITARLFLRSAIKHYGIPRSIGLDGYTANHAAVKMINRRLAGIRLPPIKIWKSRYLNNIVEQDHRAIKRRVRPMMDFKTFRTATAALCGIELVHMLRKRQAPPSWRDMPLWQQFGKLAA